MRINYYKLNRKGEPKRVRSVSEWASWYETANLQIAVDYIGKSRVSTVFLGFALIHNKTELPELWETMVSGGIMDQAMSRCSGPREWAESMHHEMVEMVKKAQHQ